MVHYMYCEEQMYQQPSSHQPKEPIFCWGSFNKAAGLEKVGLKMRAHLWHGMGVDWCLWTDKYCATQVTDVIGQDHVMDQVTPGSFWETAVWHFSEAGKGNFKYC